MFTFVALQDNQVNPLYKNRSTLKKKVTADISTSHNVKEERIVIKFSSMTSALKTYIPLHS